MVEERKVKRSGLVRVSDPGDLDVRSIRLNAGSIVGSRKIVDEHHSARAVGAKVETD